MFYNFLFFAAIGMVAFVLTIPCRSRRYTGFWPWWDAVGVCIFIFDCAVLFLIALWRGWFAF